MSLSTLQMLMLMLLGTIFISLVYWIYAVAFNTSTENIVESQVTKQEFEDDVAAVDPEADDVKQTVTFIRHGQAVHNVNWNAINDRDAELTHFGRQQVQNLRGDILATSVVFFEDVDLIVVSPLKRALQTLQLLLDNDVGTYSDKIILQPLAAERGNKLCDIGVSKAVLSAELADAKLFQGWQELEEEWWIYPESVEEFEKRMLKLKQWIQARSENNIVVVSHDGVIHSLCAKSLSNAQLTTAHWTRPS